MPNIFIDCPLCGNTGRNTADPPPETITCQNCGATLKLSSRTTSKSTPPNTPAPTASTTPADSQPAGKRIREYIDIDRLMAISDLGDLDDDLSPPPAPGPTNNKTILPKPDPEISLVKLIASARAATTGTLAAQSNRAELPPLEEENVDPLLLETSGISSTTADKGLKSINWNPVEDNDSRHSRTHWLPFADGWFGKRIAVKDTRILTPVATALATVLLSWLVITLFHSHGRFSAPAATPPPPVTITPVAPTAKQQAETVIRQFLDATTIEKQLGLVRDPDRVRPMLEHFAPTVAIGPVKSLAFQDNNHIGKLEFWQFIITFADNRSRVGNVIATSMGLKLDWESYARAGSADYAILTNDQPVTATLRVLATSSNYYNFAFNDDKAWMAVELSNSDWDEIITAYAKRESAIADQLQYRLSQSPLPQRMTLRLQLNAGDGPRRQGEILEKIADDWLLPDPTDSPVR